MSVNSLMKMRCNIYRIPNTDTLELKKDEFAFAEQDYELLYENVKCYIHQFEYSYSSSKNDSIGTTKVNKFIGYFNKNQDIKEDDKIICTQASNFDLFVTSAIPAINARTSKTSHIECMFSLLKT